MLKPTKNPALVRMFVKENKVWFMRVHLAPWSHFGPLWFPLWWKRQSGFPIPIDTAQTRLFSSSDEHIARR